MKGTIIRLHLNQGFCFIRDEEGTSRFAHARAFVEPTSFDRAREGQAVEFTPAKTPKGLRATEVTLLPAGYAVPKQDTHEED
jgi:cold shock CspA family protein